MKTSRDLLFKLGLGLQLLLIPVAFLWRFSPEANYYNWALAVCLVAVIVLSFWPQTVVVRLKRLRAIRLQFVLVATLLAISWLGYGYFHNFTRANCTPSLPLYSSSTNALVDEYRAVARGNRYCNFNAALTDRSMSVVVYHVDMFGTYWSIPLGPGISVLSAGALTALFIAIPAANLYRYKIDKRRVHGIKKEDLFV